MSSDPYPNLPGSCAVQGDAYRRQGDIYGWEGEMYHNVLVPESADWPLQRIRSQTGLEISNTATWYF